MCPVIFSVLAGGLSSLASSVGLTGLASALTTASSATSLASVGSLVPGVTTGAVNAGIAINTALLSATVSGVQSGVSASAQRKQAEATAASAQESDINSKKSEGEALGQRHQIASAEGDRRQRALRAAEATTRVVLAERGIKGGNTRRQAIRVLRGESLEAGDAAERGIVAHNRANVAAGRGSTAKRNARIIASSTNRAANIGGAVLDVGGQFLKGTQSVLPFIDT